jgi:ornithine carbamoyltransferase
MPCPPITRGEEISTDSLSAEQYYYYEAKEFLLHSQNAIMEYCIRQVIEAS